MSKMTAEGKEKKNTTKITTGIIIGSVHHNAIKRKAKSCGISIGRLLVAYQTLGKEATDMQILQADHDARHTQYADSADTPAGEQDTTP